MREEHAIPSCGCRGCSLARKEGYAAAARIAEAYAEDRRSKLKGYPPTPGDDISAALRVAAEMIRKAGGV